MTIVYNLTLQSNVLSDEDPSEWGRDKLIEYLLYNPGMVVGISSSVMTAQNQPKPVKTTKPVQKSDWIPVSPIQCRDLEPVESTHDVAENEQVKLSVVEDIDVNKLRCQHKTGFTRNKKGDIRQPSEVSLNGSKVVHRASGSHEFFDTEVDGYYVTSRKYRFEPGTGVIQFEYLSPSYVAQARKFGHTSHASRRKNKNTVSGVWLSRIDAYRVSRAVKVDIDARKQRRNVRLVARKGGE